MRLVKVHEAQLEAVAGQEGFAPSRQAVLCPVVGCTKKQLQQRSSGAVHFKTCHPDILYVRAKAPAVLQGQKGISGFLLAAPAAAATLAQTLQGGAHSRARSAWCRRGG